MSTISSLKDIENKHYKYKKKKHEKVLWILKRARNKDKLILKVKNEVINKMQKPAIFVKKV